MLQCFQDFRGNHPKGSPIFAAMNDAIAVTGSVQQLEALQQHASSCTFRMVSSLAETGDATVWICLNGFPEHASSFQGILLVHDLLHPVPEPLKNRCLRLNGWMGCLNNTTWEVAGVITPEMEQLITRLGRTYTLVPDLPGMIAPRVISMIINEAYFALEAGVSSKADIDTAMKLGTNYPYGPFEWAEKIGVEEILKLLRHFAATDARYTPAISLIQSV